MLVVSDYRDLTQTVVGTAVDELVQITTTKALAEACLTFAPPAVQFLSSPVVVVVQVVTRVQMVVPVVG
jgi:hypothetical protein